MTPEEAWEIISDNIKGDCGPDGEEWDSPELDEAQELFHHLYAPHLCAKKLFPDSPHMWPRSERMELLKGDK